MTTDCANCGYPKSEHHHEGACYGICGEFVEETAGQMLQRLGDDAALWAAEFRKTAIRLGYSDMDEGWLTGWFANAIENAEITRRARIPKFGSD